MMRKSVKTIFDCIILLFCVESKMAATNPQYYKKKQSDNDTEAHPYLGHKLQIKISEIR